MERQQFIRVLGAGLAGSEAAWQIARAGIPVVLHEMRPVSTTPAHKTAGFAELVCSNSLKSDTENTAPWLLKNELRRLDSLAMQAAEATRVPGGQALTVDRDAFSGYITLALSGLPRVSIRREEVTRIPDDGIVVVATGPLTSDTLATDIARRTGSDSLYFYDAISPIVDADTVDTSIAFRASRYGKSLSGTDDYLNCPFNRDEYEAFVDALLSAATYESHFDEKIPFFEACL
ncbi:MAG TPA: methylenetetrahydrofolate--tRNA-(uracil(54)-C(5))-methyltransferase (FADH(2)-oxidizing) TrmFO, partial [Bryobacteraceae bacterium]|nr:methylenetetrahydrofolate--tRNA-(uracil(54)-C(5))-methyltransferase (FADH(2)-oxidizing) TrmFO [Bryobacteraceae bacterium]